MALALYRKYRPATFAEVVGQEHVTEPLRTALAAGRVNHAYLFSGPRGCGKTSSARILARSLNCVQGPTADPCGECGSCIALAPEGPGSVDVVELDAASHGGVDDARDLRDRAFFTPAESRYRVFIIDEAHMVTTQGFNALLKIVEEPPEHLIFIFATTEPDKVLNTIRSRTHHYPFRLIPPGAMRELLERNCAAEGVPVEPAVLPLVVRAGGGSARDTQSVLDQLLAGAGSQGVTYDRAIALLGVTDSALIDDVIDGLAVADGAAIYDTVHKLVEAGHDPRRFAADLLDRLRDLVLLRAVPDAAGRGLVDAPEDQLTRMQQQVQRLDAGTLSRCADIVHTGLTEMRGATAPRLLLELLCARMLLPATDESEAGLRHRMDRLERRLTVSGSASAAEEPAQPEARTARSAEPAPRTRPAPEAKPAAPAPAPAQPAQPEPAPPEPTPQPAAEPAAAETPETPGALDATAVRRVWSDLLGVIRKSSRSTEAMMTNASVHAVENDTVILTHTAAPLARRLSEPRNVDVIAKALAEVLGGQWQVRCVPADQADSARTSGSGTAKPASPPAASAAPAQPARAPQPPPERPAPAAAPEPPPAPPTPQAQPQPAKPAPRSQPDDDIPLPPEPEPDEYEPPASPPRASAPSPTPVSTEPPASPAPSGPSLGGGAIDVQQLLSDQLGARPLDE
ncbi:DNA polymerase III tau subunit [Tamaricihabitans halophyticus]|uniref:DNA polymerase III subunit gamma/tau n=1 Tax=Tamaricihabitans halophyticus TaxID=1262583 RepID=A0A4R2QXX3_9PSEU|nr:DNA polymerase III subunit gamma and tau [Tamaricihabitans halophyticus]TCP54224.1 DNA polymerase III tau subunit [Tamaricihabitans halophyticus]